ncbi:MAG: hypothetical protein LBU76_07585 [Azoarcus sp.]|jgi:hypothetical protein|nr:hypothetical protein [Azoarcus sp.]
MNANGTDTKSNERKPIPHDDGKLHGLPKKGRPTDIPGKPQNPSGGDRDTYPPKKK